MQNTFIPTKTAGEPEVNWNQLRRKAFSLPLAVFAACLMIGISEYGYKQTSNSLTGLMQAYDSRISGKYLTENLLSARTGLRNYVLNKNEKHFQIYLFSIKEIPKTLDHLRKIDLTTEERTDVMIPLSRNISKKMAEMELGLSLYQEGNVNALDFLMFSDADKLDMLKIKELAERLDDINASTSEIYVEKVQSSLFWARLGVTTISLLGFAAFFLYLRQNKTLENLHRREQALQSEERNRLEQLVRERTATLTELANHLQQVREDERGHLARELHDELGALLTAAKLDVARLKSRINMDSPEVAERIKHLTETLKNGIALKRRIVEDLRPSSLANLGLSTSLEILTSEYSQRSGVEVEASLEPIELPDSTELTIYRLVQESLTNIGKYANASLIQVSVHNYQSYVAVQIQDNGQGFDLSMVRPNSHGLAGMRHRVEAAGGRLTITSAPGEGTTVSAVIPIIPIKAGSSQATA